MPVRFVSGKLGVVGLMLLMVVAGALIFLEDQIVGVVNLFNADKLQEVDYSGQSIKLTYLFAPVNLNPYQGDAVTATRLLDVYEGLVSLDANLQVRPGLAVYYGLLNDKTWEITLREGVRFHDSSTLDAADVMYSLDQARQGRSGDWMSNVESYQQINTGSLRFVLKKPDPLFLNKLAKLAIVPQGFTDFAKPVGTGPYRLVKSDDLNRLIYERFDQYWGKLPYFPKIEITALAGKNARVDALLSGETDFLVNVPPDTVEEIRSHGLQVDVIPSLEVGFVMFNLNDEHLSKIELRRAIALALHKESFLDLAMGYAKTVNQFIPNGVFGYNPDLIGINYDLAAADAESAKVISSFEKIKLPFYFPASLKLLGPYFQEQLIKIGLDIELHPLSDEDLRERMAKQDMPFYYLGWRNESGDALPFLKAVLHSRDSGTNGAFNAAKYQNAKVDTLIDKSEINLNLAERLKDMQKVLAIAVEQDIVGVPLFETQSLFAYDKDLLFEPRLDSLVYPSMLIKR